MLSRLNQIGNPSDYVPLIKILHDKLRSKLNLFVFTGCGTAFDFHKTMDYMFLVGKLIPFSYRPVLVLLTVVSNF